MLLYKKNYRLTDENIVIARDECYKTIQKSAKKRFDDNAHIDLMLEELLLRFKHTFGDSANCRVLIYKHFGSIYFRVSMLGNRRNPLAETDMDMAYISMILEEYCQNPSYRYDSRHGANVVTVEIKQKPVYNKMMKEILLACGLAILSYFIILLLLPDSVITTIYESVVSPVFSKMTAIITAIATPLVFFGVISGIVGMGSSAAVSKTGKKLLKNMFSTYSVAALLLALVILIFFPLTSYISTGGESILGDMIQMILDIIPDNLLECFVQDNSMQAIVIAIFLGLVLLMVGESAKEINQAIDKLTVVVNKMMEVACRLLPALVYFGILGMMFSDLSSIVEMYKSLLSFLIGAAALISYMLIRTRIKIKVSLKTLFSKQLPTLMINLTTSSQVAALPENENCCCNKFGINRKFIDFSVPLAVVAYMPTGAIFIGTLVMGIVGISGMPVDLFMIIKISAISVIVAIAAPPIPGSIFAVLPIIFSSCGLSSDYYALAVVFGGILGYFLPAFNGYLMQLELLITANDLKLVDREILEKSVEDLIIE